MSERTEAPTGKKLNEARAQGQVARSMELNAAVALLAGAWLLRASGGKLVAELKNLITYTLLALPDIAFDRAQPTGPWLMNLLATDALRLAPSLAVIVLGMAATGIGVTLAQTGLLWAKKRLGFHFDRLNPLTGLKRIFSTNGLVELLKALLKLGLVGWTAYSFVRGRADDMVALALTDLSVSASQWADLALSLATRVGATYLVLAFVDYGYQRWQWDKSMKMTKQEVKEEAKQQEGDPMIKNRIRSQARKIARMRMMASVPKADVVITNPVHLAVAVQYKPEEMSAPRVLAKGAHRTAERIVEIARQNNVPVVQNIPVARALYKTVEIEAEIPPDLYAALAQVLAYVFRLRKRAVRG